MHTHCACTDPPQVGNFLNGLCFSQVLCLVYGLMGFHRRIAQQGGFGLIILVTGSYILTAVTGE
jgi:hypothetical protein